MYAYDLTLGHCQHTHRIGLTKIILGDKGQPGYILKTIYIAGSDTLLFHLLTVMGHVLPYAAHLLQKFFLLKLFNFTARSAFYILLKILLHRVLIGNLFFYETVSAVALAQHRFFDLSGRIARNIGKDELARTLVTGQFHAEFIDFFFCQD